MRSAFLLLVVTVVLGIETQQVHAQKHHDSNVGQYLDRLIRDESPVLEVPAIQQAIAEIGSRIVASSGNPHRFTYSFTVLNDPVPNAFAGPGGYIYITTGLLALCESRDEVAAVLGHEVGHVNERHPTRIMRVPKGAVAAAIAGQVAGVVVADLIQRDSSPVDPILRMQLASGSFTLINGLAARVIKRIYESYGANDEFTADGLAIAYSRRAQFDGLRLADILSKVAGFSGYSLKEVPGWHRQLPVEKYPQLRDRIKKIKSKA